MNNLVLVFLGGGLGSTARYLVSTWMGAWLGPAFPWGTLTVNVCGSLLLGAVMHLGLSTDAIHPNTRLFLTTGFLGGFTTYSTFNHETLRYLQEGDWLLGGLNAIGTFGLCLLAGFLGIALVRYALGT
jgi:CrcB protein